MPLNAETPHYVILFLLAAILVLVSISDITARKIPNRAVLAIIFLSMPWIFLSSTVTAASALGAGLLTFLITVPLYFFGVLGAGDSKLLSALALFLGLGQLLNFLVFTALAGGILAICSFALHPTRTLVMLQMRGKGTFGRGLPYGVAIAVGAAGALLTPSRHVFWS